MNFSLMFFASLATGDAQRHYQLLLDAARIADRQGFAGIWTPERHFDEFGGVFPNPVVTNAALAAVTGGVIYVLFRDLMLSVTFGLALIINLFVASLAGVLAPLVLERMGRDPAVSSSVFVTFATDFTGFFVFLGLASVILL